MRPHIICHMLASIDGRVVSEHWPQAATTGMIETYLETQHRLDADAWLLGRKTMAKFACGAPQPVSASTDYPRVTWKAPGAQHGPYGVSVDRSASLHLNISRLLGHALVLVLTEDVSNDYLAELQRDGISYLFAGDTQIDFVRAIHILARDFGIRRLTLQGGGQINGEFLALDLIDEIVLMIMPVADGITGLASLFDRPAGPVRPFVLTCVERLDHNRLLVTYTREREDAEAV